MNDVTAAQGAVPKVTYLLPITKQLTLTQSAYDSSTGSRFLGVLLKFVTARPLVYVLTTSRGPERRTESGATGITRSRVPPRDRVGTVKVE